MSACAHKTTGPIIHGSEHPKWCTLCGAIHTGKGWTLPALEMVRRTPAKKHPAKKRAARGRAKK